jgi:hypothetical protein
MRGVVRLSVVPMGRRFFAARFGRDLANLRRRPGCSTFGAVADRGRECRHLLNLLPPMDSTLDLFQSIPYRFAPVRGIAQLVERRSPKP